MLNPMGGEDDNWPRSTRFLYQGSIDERQYPTIRPAAALVCFFATGLLTRSNRQSRPI
jgi:hypothetical protein